MGHIFGTLNKHQIIFRSYKTIGYVEQVIHPPPPPFQG